MDWKACGCSRVLADVPTARMLSSSWWGRQLAVLINSFRKPNEWTENPIPLTSNLSTQNAGFIGQKDWNGGKKEQFP